MSRVHPIFLLVFALLSQCAFAQQTATTVQRDSQAVAALQRALAALGGTSKPMPSSIVASGTYALFLADSTVSYPVRVKVLGLDQFRWEVDTPDQGTVATVVFGTVG